MTREQFVIATRTHQKAFRSFLVALCCGDSQLADDIAQEALIKAYISIGSLRQATQFKSWIYRIGYNTFLNYRRSRPVSSDYTEATGVISDDSADSAFEYQALYTALDRLSAAERSSILLHYMENYSIKEIAEIENISPDTVKQHLSRGRKHLYYLLSNQ